MPDHQALLWLPDRIRSHRVTVVELRGWERNEQGYYWTRWDGRHAGYNGRPNAWMWHHTATTAYTPQVKNSIGQTKANLWLGLLDGNGRLYQHDAPGRTPAVVFASGGPADYSSGRGRYPALVDAAHDIPVTHPNRAPDDFVGNRYYGNTEVVHRGDGTPVHDGVWELQQIIAEEMCRHWGWTQHRHVQHMDHTSRKVDQRFAQGAPYTGGRFRKLVKARLTNTPPPSEGEPPMWPMYRTDGFNDPTPPGRTEKRDDVIVLQARLAALGESIVVDGKLGNATLASVENITGIPAAGDVVTGVHAAAIEAKLFSDGGDGDVVVELTDHAHTAGELRILDLDDKTIEGETGGIVE